MRINAATVRKGLQSFDLQRMFVEELGWDRHTAELEIPVDGRAYLLSAVAQKRGMVSFLCQPLQDGQMPSYSERRRIDRVVAKTHFEHLIVYVDPAKTMQIWQWVKREHGKPAASREHIWHKSQPGDALIQKLDNIAFTLSEEESIGGIADVAGRVRAGFDLERVTKRFYDRFKAEHDTFLKFIKGIPDKEMHRWYVSVMLNRLMFIYFVQKKGFLHGDRAYLRTKLAASKQLGKDRFYRNVLCPLFFEGFAVKEDERSEAASKLLGKVPYLNGGLFLRHQIEEYFGEKIQIADAGFEKIFDFFDAYQWHLDERPLCQDDEINPDVLGYIFEKYINQKQMGAYYTKEDVTEYIAKNTIIPFLFEAAKKECPIAFGRDSFLWKLLREDPDRYIYDAVRAGAIDSHGNVIPLSTDIEAGVNEIAKRGRWNKAADTAYALPTETWREYVARRQRCLEIRRKLHDGEIGDINDLITLNLDVRQFAQDVIVNSEGPELVRAFYQAIEKVTVLDPTCGSGAFLFAALNVLQPLYEGCLERMAAFLIEAEHAKPSLRAERFADFRKVLASIKLHPNHDYFVLKSIMVNNLYGVDIMEEAVEICKLRLFLKLVAQVEKVEQIEPLPDIDFNIRPGNTLVGYATLAETENMLNFGDAQTRIAQKAADIDRRFQEFRQRQTGDEWRTSSKLALALKQAILKPMAELRQELDQFLAVAYGQAGKGKFEAWRKSHQPFHWFAEFYGIMQAGGFDVIIGNPPWVEYAKVKNTYTVHGYRTERCGNLHTLCSERCLSLRSRNGSFSFIVQLPLTNSSRMDAARALLRAKSQRLYVVPFDDRPGKLFEGLEHCRSVVIISRCAPIADSTRVFVTRYQRWPTETRKSLFQRFEFTELIEPLIFAGHFPKLDTEIERSAFDKMLSRSNGCIGDHLSQRPTDTFAFYQEATQYWVKGVVGLPYYAKNGRVGEPAHGRYLWFRDRDACQAGVAILNSSLFYAYFIAYGDCFHLSDKLATNFPIPANLINDRSLCSLGHKLSDDLRAHAQRKTINTKDGHRIVYDEFFAAQSKPVIDEIDRILAKHYAFTDEETDFIINYDIKYRIGGETAEEEPAVIVDAGQIFPTTARDRQLCAVALELVRAIPDLPLAAWLDGLVLPTQPALCEKALLDVGTRKRFRQLVQKHPIDLFTISQAPLPWDDLRRTLVDAKAVSIDEQAKVVREDQNWKQFRDGMGTLPSGIMKYVVNALNNITSNAAELTQVGIDATALKEAIRQARPKLAMV